MSGQAAKLDIAPAGDDVSGHVITLAPSGTLRAVFESAMTARLVMGARLRAMAAVPFMSDPRAGNQPAARGVEPTW